MMRMTAQDHPFQRADPAEYSKVSHVRFCHTFPREVDD